MTSAIGPGLPRMPFLPASEASQGHVRINTEARHRPNRLPPCLTTSVEKSYTLGRHLTDMEVEHPFHGKLDSVRIRARG